MTSLIYDWRPVPAFVLRLASICYSTAIVYTCLLRGAPQRYSGSLLDPITDLKDDATNFLALEFNFAMKSLIKTTLSRILGVLPRMIIDYRGFSVHLNPKDQSSAEIYAKYKTTGRWVHEEYEQGVISQIIALHKHAIFIDVGASYGMYSLMAATQENSGHIEKIIAIEGSPSTFEWLDKTIKSNHLTDKIALKNLAVSNKENSAVSFFSHPKYSEWNRIAEADEASDPNLPTVASATLTHILKDSGWQGDQPLIVKIDIEGGESKALEGLAKAIEIADEYCVIVEFHSKLLSSIGGGAMNFVDQILALAPAVVFEIDEGGQCLNRLSNREDFERMVQRLESGTELWQIMTNVAFGSRSLGQLFN